MIFWPSVLFEAWGAKTQTTTPFFRNECFFGLAAFGGKANKPLFSSTGVFFLASVPQASKKHLAEKSLRDPFDMRRSGWGPEDDVFSGFYRVGRPSRPPHPGAAARGGQPSYSRETREKSSSGPRPEWIFRCKLLEPYILPPG